MNKEELLQELSLKVSTGEINRDDIESYLGGVSDAQQSLVSDDKSSHFSAVKMLYVLGAAIVIIGIMIFVGQIWDDIGSFGRIAVTLGLGFIFTISGVLLNNKEEISEYSLGAVFYAIGGLMVPGGALVTISELDMNVSSLWICTLTFGAIFLFYLLLNIARKHAILTFFAIVNGTATAYLILEALVGGPFYGWFGIKDIYQYVTIAIGASYLLLAHAFRVSWNSKLVSVLSFFGSIGLLGAAFSQVFDSGIWEMFYFLVVMGGVFLSVYMKSRSVLIISTLFLVAHVAYITSEYFADSLGWPIVLIFLGFVFIGLGYASVRINKKYITNSE